jgi:hypothetical protein
VLGSVTLPQSARTKQCWDVYIPVNRQATPEKPGAFLSKVDHSLSVSVKNLHAAFRMGVFLVLNGHGVSCWLGASRDFAFGPSGTVRGHQGQFHTSAEGVGTQPSVPYATAGIFRT